MADESSADATANVEANAPKTANGVTPSPETPAIEGQKLSFADAQGILRAAGQVPTKADRDPLLHVEPRDPLAADAESDPLTDGLDLTEEVPEEAGAEETETEEGVPAETTETEAPETEAEAEEVTTAEAETAKRKRLNFNRKNEAGEFIHDDRERAILSKSAEEGISYREAERRLFGDTKPAEGEAKTETAKPEPTVEEITASIDALKKERREAADNFDNVKHVELTEQIEDLLDQRSAARERQAKKEATKQEAQSRLQADQQTSMAQAAELYPDSIKAGTKLNAEITAEIARLTRVNPGSFQDPEWPLAVAAKVAARHGIAPKASAPKPPVAKTKEVTPVPAARRPSRAVPSPSSGGVSGAVPTNKVADLSRQIAEAKAKGDLPTITRLMKQATTLAGAH